MIGPTKSFSKGLIAKLAPESKMTGRKMALNEEDTGQHWLELVLIAVYALDVIEEPLVGASF